MWNRRGWLGLLWLSSLSLASESGAFGIIRGFGATPQEVRQNAARWTGATGLDDGLQVGVHAGLGAALGARYSG